MDIKRRLIISNTITVIVPLLVTIIVAFVYIFISSSFFNKDFSYDSFKKLVEIKAELENTKNEILARQSNAIEDKKFHSYMAHRLKDINGEVLIFKKDKLIFASRHFEKIDLDKSLIMAQIPSQSDTIDINGKTYSFYATQLKFKDGTLGYAIILTLVFQGLGVFEKLAIILIIVFLGTYIAINFIMSYWFTKRIINPLAQLKTASDEISRGDLSFEVIEAGDKEIRELCADFERMRIQLKDSVNEKMKYDENRTTLVSSISHDLKTPITSIKGYVKGILDGVANTPEKMERYLKTIYSKTEQVDSMIDDLLLYSKLDLKSLPFNFEKTDILDYFNYCIHETALELEKHQIKISLENYLETCKYVMMDRERLMRVILNIIDNSRKYMNKTKGEIVIMLRETNSSIIIEIKDNGAGINKEEVNKIFDRFYRADSSRSGASGSGIGLAIAKQIVEGHEGRIWAVSHDTEGMSVLISLSKIL